MADLVQSDVNASHVAEQASRDVRRVTVTTSSCRPTDAYETKDTFDIHIDDDPEAIAARMLEALPDTFTA